MFKIHFHLFSVSTWPHLSSSFYYNFEHMCMVKKDDWRTVAWGIRIKKKIPASQYLIVKSYWHRIQLGRKDISLRTYGQINVSPFNVCRHNHVHSLHLLLSNGSTYLFTRNHMSLSRCALPSHFPLWGTNNSIILKCPGQLWALSDKHLCFKGQCQCHLLGQVVLIYWWWIRPSCLLITTALCKFTS